MDNLKSVVQETMRGYSGRGINGSSYFMQDDSHDVMSIVGQYTVRGEHFVDTSLLVRVLDNRIIIERDVNNKPLVDALLQAGIPREHIILAYAGEQVKEIV
jgi:CTP:phosphocholine cytidylyltransferase-like protein